MRFYLEGFKPLDDPLQIPTFHRRGRKH